MAWKIFKFFGKKETQQIRTSDRLYSAAFNALGLDSLQAVTIMGDKPFRDFQYSGEEYQTYVATIGVTEAKKDGSGGGRLFLLVLGTDDPESLRRIEDAEACMALRLDGEDNIPAQWALTEWAHKVSTIGFPTVEMIVESLRAFMVVCGFGGRRLTKVSTSWQRRFEGAEAPDFDEWSIRGFDVMKNVEVWREPKVSKERDGSKETLNREEAASLKELLAAFTAAKARDPKGYEAFMSGQEPEVVTTTTTTSESAPADKRGAKANAAK